MNLPLDETRLSSTLSATSPKTRVKNQASELDCGGLASMSERIHSILSGLKWIGGPMSSVTIYRSAEPISSLRAARNDVITQRFQ